MIMFSIRKIDFLVIVFGFSGHSISSTQATISPDLAAAIAKVLKLGVYISDSRPPLKAEQDGSSIKLGELGLIRLDSNSIKNLAKATKNDTNILGVSFKVDDPKHAELFKSITIQKKDPSIQPDLRGHGEWFQATLPKVSLKIYAVDNKGEKQIGNEQIIGYGESLHTQKFEYPSNSKASYSVSFGSKDIFTKLLDLSKSTVVQDIKINGVRTYHTSGDKTKEITLTVSKIPGNAILKLVIPKD